MAPKKPAKKTTAKKTSTPAAQQERVNAMQEMVASAGLEHQLNGTTLMEQIVRHENDELLAQAFEDAQKQELSAELKNKSLPEPEHSEQRRLRRLKRGGEDEAMVAMAV